jgi:hypothetical protein
MIQLSKRLAALQMAGAVGAGAWLLSVAVAGAAGQTPTPAAIPPALELPAGGIVFASRDKLFVETEKLTIALDSIEIDYLVRSTSSKTQALVMAFPLPTIDMSGLYGAELAIPAYDPANPTNFVGYWTTLDTVPVDPDVDVRALAVGQIDVTAALNALGLPLYPLAPEMDDKLADLSMEQKQSLAEAGILGMDDGPAEPLWALKTTFHWRHALKPDATVAIRHHYKPVAGSAPWSAELAAKAKTKYCLKDEQIADLDKRAEGGKPPTVYWVHYVPGHNSWLKGPSVLHDLVVVRPEGNGLAATCAAGIREDSETRIKIVSTNRTDDADIEVLFVE